MKRLPITGASIATPILDEGKLKRVLINLRVSKAFDDTEIHELYVKLGQVYGAWLSEQEAAEVTPVANALRSTAGNLIAASKLLNGHQDGFRTNIEIAATSQAARILALDPRIGSLKKAHASIITFREHADRLGHACMVAYADLVRKGSNDGRAPYHWYDEFTVLLLQIAQKAGVGPNLNKDRANKARGGWLFMAAQALEPFLPSYMRSPSPEACGKRLERSRKRLLKRRGQNPRAG
jgi:hypothetical protein